MESTNYHSFNEEVYSLTRDSVQAVVEIVAVLSVVVLEGEGAEMLHLLRRLLRHHQTVQQQPVLTEAIHLHTLQPRSAEEEEAINLIMRMADLQLRNKKLLKKSSKGESDEASDDEPCNFNININNSNNNSKH